MTSPTKNPSSDSIDPERNRLTSICSSSDGQKSFDDSEGQVEEYIDVQDLVVDRHRLDEINSMSNVERAMYNEFIKQTPDLPHHREALLKRAAETIKSTVKFPKKQNIHIQNCKVVHIGNTINITEYVVLKNRNNEDKNCDPQDFEDYKNYFYIKRRKDWLANKMPALQMDPMENPVKYIIICHTASPSYTTQIENIEAMRIIQNFHQKSREWLDIGYNFCIGSDGNIYEGRGWDYWGSHTLGYNGCSMGIAFIGYFENDLPPPVSLRRCKELISHGVKIGKIREDYELIAQSQCRPFKSPGKRLFEEISTWKKFNPHIKNSDPCFYSPVLKEE